MSWVYKRATGENLYTVGFYAPDGSRDGARKAVSELNGGPRLEAAALMIAANAVKALEAIADILETRSIRVEILER